MKILSDKELIEVQEKQIQMKNRRERSFEFWYEDVLAEIYFSVSPTEFSDGQIERNYAQYIYDSQRWSWNGWDIKQAAHLMIDWNKGRPWK